MLLNKTSKKIIKYTPKSIKKLIKIFLNDIANFIDSITLPFNLIKERRIKKMWLSKKELEKYRKKIKIYDCFSFFNELEVLDIRLNILNDYVDYFVLVESTLTHSGLPKELFYEKNKYLFKKFEHKIIHYIIENPLESFKDVQTRLNNTKITDIEKNILEKTLISDNIDRSSIPSLRIFYQKECIKKALIGLSDNDFCYISDLDEIWNPEVFIDYSKNDIFKFKQDNYVYYLNNRSNENWIGWTGTIGTKYKNIKNGCINHLLTFGKNKFTIIRNGGWHFTWQGGTEKIKNKLEAYDHQEINTDKIKRQIKDTISENKDIRGRHIKFWKDESRLPKYLLENKGKYEKLFIK